MNHRHAALFGWASSITLHAGMIAYVLWRTSAPDLDMEFSLPDSVEFGLTEAHTVAAGASAPPPAAEASESGEGEGNAADAGVPRDGGVSDGGRRVRDAGQLVAEGEGAEGEGQGAEGEGAGVAFLPAGSQIALRMDIQRVRRSPLAADVRGVLSAMPDWQVLLEGSGIEPIDDLDRLLVASPNLERSRLIAAGRVSADEGSIRAAAERLATANGATLTWRTAEGVPVADWHDHDPSERVVALIGPQHFVIARAEDLSRVLAVARVRASRDEERPEASPDQPPREHPADALLSMREGEGLSLEVEGFRNFAQARPGRRSPLAMLPSRLRLGMLEQPEGVGARIRGDFDDADQARAAAAYWDEMRQAYSRNIIASVLGLSGVLSRLSVRSESATLRAEVDISTAEMRRLLSLVRGFFADRARARGSGTEHRSGARAAGCADCACCACCARCARTDRAGPRSRRRVSRRDRYTKNAPPGPPRDGALLGSRRRIRVSNRRGGQGDRSGAEHLVLELLQRGRAELLRRRDVLDDDLARRRDPNLGVLLRRHLANLELEHVRDDEFPRSAPPELALDQLSESLEDRRDLLLGQFGHVGELGDDRGLGHPLARARRCCCVRHASLHDEIRGRHTKPPKIGPAASGGIYALAFGA